MKRNLYLLLTAISLGACTAGSPAQVELKASSSAVIKQPVLVRVSDPSTVCMVNDQYMETPQIPVIVGDKTYFGCCQMCEAKLKNNAAIRSAVDPTSLRSVDKATAVIGRDASGKVFYFESEQALAKFKSKG